MGICLLQVQGTAARRCLWRLALCREMVAADHRARLPAVWSASMRGCRLRWAAYLPGCCAAVGGCWSGAGHRWWHHVELCLLTSHVNPAGRSGLDAVSARESGNATPENQPGRNFGVRDCCLAASGDCVLPTTATLANLAAQLCAYSSWRFMTRDTFNSWSAYGPEHQPAHQPAFAENEDPDAFATRAIRFGQLWPRLRSLAGACCLASQPVTQGSCKLQHCE